MSLKGPFAGPNWTPAGPTNGAYIIESVDSIYRDERGFPLTQYTIQRINGASLKEHWAAQRNQVYKQQYQRLQHDTGLKYKNGIFLKLGTGMIAQRSSVDCTEIYIILLDKSAVCKADAASLRLEAAF